MTAAEANRLGSHDGRPRGVPERRRQAAVDRRRASWRRPTTSRSTSDKVWGNSPPARARRRRDRHRHRRRPEGLPVSQSDSRSRVIATAVTNPYAKTATDNYGHGTHVAGIIAGNTSTGRTTTRCAASTSAWRRTQTWSRSRSPTTPASATILDVIYGLQFVGRPQGRPTTSASQPVARVERRRVLQDGPARRGGRVGLVQAASSWSRQRVTAAPTPDAVKYAPGNDPFVISVGAVDDMGTDKPARRQARRLVEPRPDPGRLRQARGRSRRARTSSRPLAPNSEFKHAVPELHRRRTSTSGPAARRCPHRWWPARWPSCSRTDPSLTPDAVKGILMTTRNIQAAGDEARRRSDAVNEGDDSTANPNAGLDAEHGRQRDHR